MFKSANLKIVCILILVSLFLEADLQSLPLSDSKTNINETFEEITNSTANVTGNDFFWILPDTSGSNEENKIEHNNNQTTLEDVIETDQQAMDLQNLMNDIGEHSEKIDELAEENKTPQLQWNNTSTPFYINANENIVLHRNNCNLEIPIDSTHEVKIEIKFEPLRVNARGKCCIVLNGLEDAMLAVLITNIHLFNDPRNGYGEILKVVLSNYGIDFTLKEYTKNYQNPSLLLTETHKAFILLYYDTSTASKDYSHFDLEVFTYGKNENSMTQETHHFKYHG